jgi:lysophospholipase L1-like esterase
VVGTHGWRVGPRRFKLMLERMIALARYDHRLVLVVDINPPGPRIVYAMPGIDKRRDLYQEIVHKVVAEAAAERPDVRLIPTSTIVDDLGIDAALPDGYHWSAAAHSRVAQMLAAEVIDWISLVEAGSA